MQIREVARVKAGQMREARSGCCARHGMEDARRKAGQIREARQGKCSSKAIQMRNPCQFRCAIQGKAEAQCKAW
jgi:hypothetical protein